ncbi:MAG: methyl-accepting chemotaxis protein [Motiliproteus sp.]
MRIINIGFKQKLLLAVVFTLIGFSVLATLSITSLNSLVAASDDVDRLNQQQAHLFRLKLDMMEQISHLATGNGDVAAELDQFYQTHQPIVSSGGAAGLADDSLQLLLSEWVETRKHWLAATDVLGHDSSSGLRGEMNTSMTALGDGLFAAMRERFQVIQESLDRLIDNQDEPSFVDVKAALEHFYALVLEQNFEEFFDPKVAAVRTPLDLFGAQLIDLAKYDRIAVNNLEQILSIISTRSEQQNSLLHQARVAAISASDTASMKILISCLLIAAVVLGLLLIAHRQASRTLHQAVTSLVKISEGDLTQRLAVDLRRNDEFDQVGLAVNQLTETLSEVLSQVINGSAELQTMSGELTSTIDKMVTGSELTNQQTEMAATAIEQISATVNDMAGATEESHQQSLEAGDVAESGGVVINNALATMVTLAQVFEDLDQRGIALNNASARVDDVTDMINGLASQTNLLALNAAIEAARAGEAGRGFSVVADEVRRLAEKTVGATSEIDSIISDMQQQLQGLMAAMAAGANNVLQSRELGDSAAGVVEQIKSLVNLTTDRSSQLSVSIEEIAQTSVSISENMVDVTDGTQKGNQLGREILVFAGDVANLAAQQQSMTERFQCR